jgi:hypothetical protein
MLTAKITVLVSQQDSFALTGEVDESQIHVCFEKKHNWQVAM